MKFLIQFVNNFIIVLPLWTFGGYMQKNGVPDYILIAYIIFAAGLILLITRIERLENKK